jgi:hypothetical protein
MSDLAARRQLNRGYDDGMTRALEIVLTPLFLGGIGFALDAWLGTRPVLTITLGVLGVVGIFVKMWLGYDREMRAHEAEGAWRGTPAAAGEPQADEAAATVPTWQGVRRPAPRPDASPALARPGYVTAVAATFRFLRNQVDTRKGEDMEGRVP